jgi:hypothetical protein
MHNGIIIIFSTNRKKCVDFVWHICLVWCTLNPEIENFFFFLFGSLSLQSGLKGRVGYLTGVTLAATYRQNKLNK